MWLGEQITNKGVGNGISLIIMAGILSSIPTMFVTAFNSLVTEGTTQVVALGIAKFALFVIIYVAIIIGIIYEHFRKCKKKTIASENKQKEYRHACPEGLIFLDFSVLFSYNDATATQRAVFSVCSAAHSA